MQPPDPNRNPFEHRAKFGVLLDVRELAQTLRENDPDEVDQWVRENAQDIEGVQVVLGLLIRYIVARGL